MEAVFQQMKALGVENPFGDVDVSKYKDQAQQIWEMLDDMAEKDPRVKMFANIVRATQNVTTHDAITVQAYSKFVKQQMESARAEKLGRKTLLPDVGLCLISRIDSVDTSKTYTNSMSGESRPPLPSDMKADALFYVNLVSHSSVLPALSSGDRKPMHELEKSQITVHALLNMEIPLAIGDPRPVRGTARSEWALDVLLHPWIVRKLESVKEFVPFFIEFVLTAIQEETGIAMSPMRTKVLDTADYIGGLKGSGGPVEVVGTRKTEEPVPFDLGADKSKPPVTKEAPTASAASAKHSEAKSLSSPSDVLRELKRESDRAPREKDLATTLAPPTAKAAVKLVHEVNVELIPVCDVQQEAADGTLVVTAVFNQDIVDKERLQLSAIDLTIFDDHLDISVSPDMLKDEVVASTVQLSITHHFKLRIDSDRAKAKFMRATGTLRVQLPIVEGAT